jgi:hypothetical protein
MQEQAMAYARKMYEKSGQPKHENQTETNKTDCNPPKNNPVNNTFFGNNGRVNNIFSVRTNNSSESDMSLILALILILSKDSGDSILILALLYILS